MQQLKKTLAILMLVTTIGSQSFAQTQDYQGTFNLDAMLKFNRMLDLQTCRQNKKNKNVPRKYCKTMDARLPEMKKDYF